MHIVVILNGLFKLCVCVCINNKEREMMNLRGSKGTMRRVEGKQKEGVEGEKTEML